MPPPEQGKIKNCSECRRLKIKCIRDGDSWPCVPCRRRRCDDLCPEGFVGTSEKATSERLLRHYRTKVASLESELEAERIINRRLREESPDLDESDQVQTDALYHCQVQETQQQYPTNSTNNEGAAASIAYTQDYLVSNNRSFHGRSTGAYYVHPSNEGPSQMLLPYYSALRRAQAAIREIAFEEAMQLLRTYIESVTWMYSPISHATIQRYTQRAYGHSCTASEMSIVCFALALGNHFQKSVDREAKELHPKLYNFGLACLLRSETFEKPTLEAAAAAHLCTSYLFSQGEPGKSQAAWQMLGMGIRLAVSLGLHCDQSELGLSKEIPLKQIRGFLGAICLQSLNFGRPGMLPNVITCPKPLTDQLFHTIKYDLCDLFSKINLILSQPQLPEHFEAMKLDSQLRAFESSIPQLLNLQRPLPEHWDPHIIPQRHMLSLLIHKALLFLHRPWFGRALLTAEESLFSPLASSFAAAVKSARQHTQLYESALKSNPMISSWWFFVFHLFTAAVVQAQVLIRSPNSLLASQCQDDFELSYSLLGKASQYSKIAAKGVNLLSSVRAEILFDFAAQASKNRNDTALLAATAIVELGTNNSVGIARSTSLHEGTGIITEESSSCSTTTTTFSGHKSTPQDGESLLTNLADIISAEFLPPEFLNQSEWMDMDPLLQAAVYWHPQSASK